MLECYFAVSPAAAIAAMAALRRDCAQRVIAARRRTTSATAAAALAARDEGGGDPAAVVVAAAQRDFALNAALDATNTAIMVGDQILPSMLRVECGLEVPTLTASRRMQQLLGRFARAIAERAAAILFAHDGSGRESGELDAAAFERAAAQVRGHSLCLGLFFFFAHSSISFQSPPPPLS